MFQFSVGLNGVGTKAVNALSARVRGRVSWREGKFRRATFERGKLKSEKQGKDADAQDGTLVRFSPDPHDLQADTHWNDEFIAHRLRYYAYLNTGLTLTYNGKSFKSPGGLADLLTEEIGDEQPLYEIVHCKQDRLEFAFTHTHAYGESYFSFVNGQFTNDGGTHQSAFREGLLQGRERVREQELRGRGRARRHGRRRRHQAQGPGLREPDQEQARQHRRPAVDHQGGEGAGARSGCTRTPPRPRQLLEKIKTNERIRKELSAIKKQARERAKKVAIRIPKLIDCKVHFDDAARRAPRGVDDLHRRGRLGRRRR